MLKPESTILHTFVSFFRAITRTTQYPTCIMYIAITYTPRKDGEGVKDVGYISPTLPTLAVHVSQSSNLEKPVDHSPRLGEITKLVTPTAAMFISSERGVRTCSLNKGSSRIQITLEFDSSLTW